MELKDVALALMVVHFLAPFAGSSAQTPPYSSPPSISACPLNFTVLDQYPYVAHTVNAHARRTRCSVFDSGLQLVLALYLRETGYFLIPRGTSKVCKEAYQIQLESQGVTKFNATSDCGSSPLLAERGTNVCLGIQTAQDFRNAISQDELSSLNSSCYVNLIQDTDCGTCNRPLTSVQGALNSASPYGVCSDIVSEYTGGIINLAGPLDRGTASCLFYISSSTSSGYRNTLKFIGVGVGGMLLVCMLVALFFFVRHRRRKARIRAAYKKRTKDSLMPSVKWFDIDELYRATGNFNRENMLGTGGYGNVYKGTLDDGSVVAVKRFKNCSPAGDKEFVHEVEIISSVRHKHLVGIQGCCVDAGGFQGHQRIIVLDYMPNGSLHEHLFTPGRFLDWPTRKRIALGMARGLEYLHHEALPAIFHRDIKASNILLDMNFDARLADFGLAKFTPDGVSHVTTRVAGTRGYLAPEYAMYGQVNAKSDVYSFGMVVLELITGRKALSTVKDDPPQALLSDWAWPLVRRGQWRTIIDPRLAETAGPHEEMERFIVVALLCSHPQVFPRPSVDQALKILEKEVSTIPTIPDRPLPLTSSQTQINESLSHEPLHRSGPAGFSSFFHAYARPGSLEAAHRHPNSEQEVIESRLHNGERNEVHTFP